MPISRWTARRRVLFLVPALVLAAALAGAGFLVARRVEHSVDGSGAAGRPTVTVTPTDAPTATRSAGSTPARSAPPSTSPSTSPPASPSASPPASPSESASPSPAADYHQVLGLGDSVTAGTNCNCTDFITQLARLLADHQDTDVTAVNRGVAGSTASDLLGDLGSDDGLRSTVAASDVIVITIGANDLSPSLDDWEQSGACDSSCYQPGIDQMSSDLTKIIATVRSLRHGAPTSVLVTDYWNVFTDGSVAEQNESKGYLAWSDQVTRAANTAICHAAAAGSADCVDLYAPFKGDGDADPTGLLADDGDHPNAAGTALIARTLYSELEHPTARAGTQ